MRISYLNQYNQINFDAHTYKIRPKNDEVTIQTDNEPYLGDSPYLISPNFYEWDTNKKSMKKEGKYFTQNIPITSNIINYHIEYDDSGKIDNKNGKDYEINCKKMQQNASLYLRKLHNQPIIHAIKSGKATGKLLHQENIGLNNSDFINNINEPTILLAKKFHTNMSNPNIVGIIYTSDDSGSFTHLSTQLRTRTDVCGAIYNPKIIEKLEKLNGKNIELELKDNYIKFNETNKTYSPKQYKKINVPQQKNCDKILTSNEYNSDIIGAKAVNLKRLEELSKSKKIHSIIPKSIALPNNYIEKLFTENNDKIYNDENSKNNMNEILSKMKEQKINSNPFMVRSSFNGEDLPNYSAAGIYSSTCVYKNIEPEDTREGLYYAIETVADSKMSKDAIASRKRHKIPDNDIKTGIIIQDFIDEDYKFTIYTDDDNHNLKIDLYSDNAWFYENAIQPHIFTYNKDTKKLQYDAIQMDNISVTFDEDMNIINSDKIENNLSNNKKLFKQLHNIIDDALTIEQEFGVPQDIEGGIKDDNTYIWQTRNIVK